MVVREVHVCAYRLYYSEEMNRVLCDYSGGIFVVTVYGLGRFVNYGNEAPKFGLEYQWAAPRRHKALRRKCRHITLVF